MPFSAILFDFFGTLVEYQHAAAGDGFARSHAWWTERGGALAYSEFLESWTVMSDQFESAANISLDEYRLEELVGAFLESHDIRATQSSSFIEIFIHEWSANVVYSDAIHSAVRDLREGFRLGVVTNTHLDFLVPTHLEGMGILDCFSEVITSCGHGKRKPHPAIFEHALARIGASPESTLFIGDSLEADFHGARNVGMTALLIDPNEQSGLPVTDRIASVAGLPAWLGRR